MTKKKDIVKNKEGRPTKYTPELGQRICDAIASSADGLISICKRNPDFPVHQNVYVWLYKHDEFRVIYEKAKEAQAHILVDVNSEIANDTSNDIIRDDNGKIILNSVAVLRARLQINNNHWAAARLNRKKYGDHNQNEDKSDSNDKIREEVQELRRRLDEQSKKDY